MQDRAKKEVLKEFKTMPGVGPRVAEDLYGLGFRSIQELKDQNPEFLYKQLCQLQGCLVDRCMLYVLRCIVYYASNTVHDPELLKWWRWKG